MFVRLFCSYSVRSHSLSLARSLSIYLSISVTCDLFILVHPILLSLILIFRIIFKKRKIEIHCDFCKTYDRDVQRTPIFDLCIQTGKNRLREKKRKNRQDQGLRR